MTGARFLGQNFKIVTERPSSMDPFFMGMLKRGVIYLEMNSFVENVRKPE